MCQSRNVTGDIFNEGEEIMFLDTVYSEVAVINDGTKPWTTVLCLNDFTIEFKTDTGADVTVILAIMYDKSRDGPLVLSDRVL